MSEDSTAGVSAAEFAGQVHESASHVRITPLPMLRAEREAAELAAVMARRAAYWARKARRAHMFRWAAYWAGCALVGVIVAAIGGH